MMHGRSVAALALDVALGAASFLLVDLWFALGGEIRWPELVLRTLMFALLFGAIQVGRLLMATGGEGGDDRG